VSTQRFRDGGDPVEDKPDPRNAAGGGHVRPGATAQGAVPAAGNVAEPQLDPTPDRIEPPPSRSFLAFDVPRVRGELAALRVSYSEPHNCYTAYIGACRACAQARVEHDAGDEDRDQWRGAKGLWLVGGGLYHLGKSAGCSVEGLLPDGRPRGADRWDGPTGIQG
jgi:hypothetical protein